MDSKARILAFASELFLKYGVRSVTMDDLAQQMAISKKTIYLSFRNKKELVKAVADQYFKKEMDISEDIIKQSSDAIDELVRIVTWSVNVIQTLAPNLLFEIKKYYPESWEVFNQFQQGYIFEKVRNNLMRGIQEGLYREQLRIDIITGLRLLQIEGTLLQQHFPRNQFDPIEVQLVVFEHYMLGLVTDKGRELLRQYLSTTPFSTSQSFIES